MKFPIFKKTNDLEKIFIISSLLVVGFILSAIVSVLLINFFDDTMASVSLMKWSQASSQLLVFIIPPVAFACLVFKNPFKKLGFNKIPLWSLLGVLMIFAINPINNVLAEWNDSLQLPESMKALEEQLKFMQARTTALTKQMLDVDNIGGLIVNIIMIAGFAAFGEELLFRSLMQTYLCKRLKNIHVGIILTSLLFSLIHFELYSFLPRVVLGLLLGYMFYYSGTVLVPMLMHFCNNVTIVIIYYLNNKGITDVDVDSFGQTSAFWIVFSVLSMIALFYFVIKNYKKDFPEENDCLMKM